MTFKERFLLFLKGVAMGGADIIPGVSGGTIAFITGIYEELIDSIKSVDATAIQLLFKLKIADFWKHINGNFLVTLFGGIFLSLFSLVNVVSYLLYNEPIALWSFFFGLILASAILVLRRIKKWNVLILVATVLGTFIGFIITTFAPAESENSLLSVFLSGMLAICAMILPGISGSFILLLLGKYEFIINAIRDFRVDVILLFGIGCVAGLAAFSRVISWVLKKYHDITVALLAGFMVGSLNKIWPWKEVIQFRINSEGEQVPLFDRSIMPQQYQELTGNNPQVLKALLFVLLGLFIVVGIDRIATWSANSKKG